MKRRIHMGFNTGFHEKMDALDLIITALKDHEKRLDDISHKLENLLKMMESGEIHVKSGEGRLEKNSEVISAKKMPMVVCSDWSDFREACREARVVAFEFTKNSFSLYSIVNGEIFKYFEELPKRELKIVDEESRISIDKASMSKIELLQFLIEGRLNCGLKITVRTSRTRLSEREHLLELRYDIKAEDVREFLSKELNLPKNRIVSGKIHYL